MQRIKQGIKAVLRLRGFALLLALYGGGCIGHLCPQIKYARAVAPQLPAFEPVQGAQALPVVPYQPQRSGKQYGAQGKESGIGVVALLEPKTQPHTNGLGHKQPGNSPTHTEAIGLIMWPQKSRFGMAYGNPSLFA